jgi:beta-glucanase (GH16 family)/PKD repeat protein
MRIFPPSSLYRIALYSVFAVAAALLTGGVLAGCDQSPMNDDGDNVITANSQRISFEVRPGAPDTTQQLTLTYTNLAARPRPEEVPDPFSIDLVEDTGSTDNGTSVFNVTFSPSEDITTFVEPVRFDADGRTVTIQLFGDVGFDDTLITDYLGGGVVDAEVGPAADPLPPIFFFNGIAGANIVDGQLNVEGAETGGPGVFPGLAHGLNEVVDFTDTQVVVARMKVSEDSPGPAFVRLALNTTDGPDANASIEPLVKEVPADGEYREYYFDFRDNFAQFDGQPADPSIVGEVVLLVNDGGSLGFLGRSDTFTGTLSVARLARRGDIPGEEDDGGNGGGGENTPPSATFSFEPGSPLVDESITFTDNSTDDGMIASREWDFGDGTTASGAEVSHAYSEAGDYTVSLTVTDDEGASATASQTVTVATDDGGTSDFRGDDDGDGRITFDDFEDGIEEGEYFTFAGGGAGIGLAETEDVPMESGGTTALEATIEGGEGGGFAGYGKGTGSEIEVQGLDLSDLGDDPYLTMYIRSNATVPYTLEINLQEDQDGNGTFDGSGAVDDEFQYDYAVSPDASGYTRISVPLSAFVDDNAVNSGGDGELSNRIANLIFAIGNMPGETFTFTVDDIIYSDTDLSDSPDNSSASACANQSGYELFFEDNFDAPNEEFWDRGNATFNGNLAYFRPENITYEDGKMVLNLREEQYQGRPYTGAELRTDNEDGFYSYGCYEVRMKTAGPSGTVSSFFAFRYNPWQEIDIEVVGKNNNSTLTNIYFNDGDPGDANNDAYQVPPFPRGIGQPYDASQEFHTYAFEWLPGEIKWYRDGQLVKQATVDGASPSEIPDLDMQIMMNLWVSDSPSFAGEVDDSNFPVRSEYDWVRFYRPVE